MADDVVETPGAVRVSDGERQRVADRLARAHGEGRLTLVEFDERVRAAHGAVVRDDLAPLLADLPEAAGGHATRPAPVVGTPWSHRPHRSPGPFPGTAPGLLPCGRTAPTGRAAVGAWAAVSVLNVLIWLAVVVGTGSAVYPWWLWVAGPWGVALLLGGLAERSAAGRWVSGPARATSGPCGSRRRGGSSPR